MQNTAFIIEGLKNEQWNSNSAIINGFYPYVYEDGLAPFYIGSDLYIVTSTYGVGFKWNGTSWDFNSDIMAGLDYTFFSNTPQITIFYIGSDLYLIAGKLNNGFLGFKWNGSSWISDNNIIWGLSSTSDGNFPCVFNIGSDLYLINGDYSGNWQGYKHNGTNWSSNSSIITGLPDVGTYATIAVFYKNNKLYAITGARDGTSKAWIWNGSSWYEYYPLESGLSDVGDYSYPTIIIIGSDIYLVIQNNQASNLCFGYKWY